jgi:hypothetical protein
MPLVCSYLDSDSQQWIEYDVVLPGSTSDMIKLAAGSDYESIGIAVDAENDVSVIVGFKRARSEAFEKVIQDLMPHCKVVNAESVATLSVGASWTCYLDQSEGHSTSLHRFEHVALPEMPDVTCPVCFYDLHPMLIPVHLEGHEKVESGLVVEPEEFAELSAQARASFEESEDLPIWVLGAMEAVVTTLLLRVRAANARNN